MRRFLTVLMLLLPLSIHAAKKPYSLVWNDFNIKDDTGLMVLGQICTRTPSLDMNSRWSIGCECLDREYADFDQIKDFYSELGAGYARVQSGWARCEKEKGIYDFEWLDKIVDGLLERGVKPWMCLCYGNPIYSDGGISLNATIFTDAKTMAAWERYVQAVTKHFKGRVYMYEVWNEPDSGENKKYPERYGDLFAATAKAIRKSDADVLIAGGSFTARFRMDWITKALDRIAEKGAIKHLQAVTFHPYYPIPEEATDAILRLKDLVRGYNPSAILLQGESGCPSQLEYNHALCYHKWTEYSQVKWILRRMFCDFSLDVPSSIFTMVDLQYDFMLQSFGLVRMNLLKEPVYKRPSFYAVSHMVALLDSKMKPFSGIEVTESSGKEIKSVGVSKDGKCIAVAYWKGDDKPSDTLEKDKVNALVQGVIFENPVLLDPITGRVYDLSYVMLRGGQQRGSRATKFTGLPLWDAPLVIIEKEEFDWTAYQLPEGYVPFVDHVGL